MKMLNSLLSASPFALVYDDFPDAYIPEVWARESLAILEENMVLGGLVYRDFQNQIADQGDTVNTRRPGEFSLNRITTADSISLQSTTATNIPVVLNQHLEVSFPIKDADQTLAFKDLVDEYLHPAVLTIARGVDKVLASQVYQFLGNQAGSLGGMTGDTALSYLLGARQVLNRNKAYDQGRNLVLGTVSETALLSDAKFIQAYSVGDEGTAMRTASLGEKFGFQTFLSQNQPYVDPTASSDVVTGAINNASGYTAGTSSFTVDGLSAAITNGTWITIDGDNTPLQVSGTTGGATPTAITTTQKTRYAVVDNAVVTIYKPAAVNLSAGYPIGYIKSIIFNGLTNPPQVGQMVSDAAGNIYGILQVDTGASTILLDRPLVAALANTAKLFLGPVGSYNFGFHRNAIALVNRPLAAPRPGTGARAAVVNYNNFSMRVVMSYNHTTLSHMVTVDTLVGVAVLDPKLGVVLLG